MDNEQKLGKVVYGWWLIPEDYRLRYSDARVAVVGETHSVNPPIIPCHNGLHASQRLQHALNLCPDSSTQLFMVKLHGQLSGHSWDKNTRTYEKVAAQHRTYMGHVTLDNAIRDIILRIIRLGITEHNARIKRHGKRAGYAPLPKPLIEFAKDGVITEAFSETIRDKAFDVDPFQRLRESLKVLSQRGITHKQLDNVIRKISDQFALELGAVWAITEHVVEKLMQEQIALTKAKTKKLPRR